jgi:Sec-independent protein translocase protein TatA
MLDLSPEKLTVLLLIAVMILAPHRLPATARTIASGLVQARRLAANLTRPVHETLQEPRRLLNDALAYLRTTGQPVHTTSPMAPPDAIELPADPDLN